MSAFVLVLLLSLQATSGAPTTPPTTAPPNATVAPTPAYFESVSILEITSGTVGTISSVALFVYYAKYPVLRAYPNPLMFW